MSRLAEELVRLSRNAPQTSEIAGVNQKVATRVLIVTVVGDALIILGVSLFTFWLRFRSHFAFIGADSKIPVQEYAGYFVLGTLGLMLILFHYRFYEFSQVLRYRQVSFLILRSCGLWMVGVLCVTRVFNFQPPLSRAYCLLTAFHLAVALLFWRLLLYRVLSMEKYSRHLRERILFIGWNDLSARRRDTAHE